MALGAGMALGELWASGVKLPGMALKITVGMFAAAAAAEGVITVLALKAIEGVNKDWVRKPAEVSMGQLKAIAAAALVLVSLGVFASTSPDVLQALSQQVGLREHASVATPFTGYETSWLTGAWLRQVTAGVVGLCLVFVLSTSAARMLRGGPRG